MAASNNEVQQIARLADVTSKRARVEVESGLHDVEHQAERYRAESENFIGAEGWPSSNSLSCV